MFMCKLLFTISSSVLSSVFSSISSIILGFFPLALLILVLFSLISSLVSISSISELSWLFSSLILLLFLFCFDLFLLFFSFNPSLRLNWDSFMIVRSLWNLLLKEFFISKKCLSLSSKFLLWLWFLEKLISAELQITNSSFISQLWTFSEKFSILMCI